MPSVTSHTTSSSLVAPPLTLSGLLASRARQRPDQIAFRYLGDPTAVTAWSYQQIHARACRVAQQLSPLAQPGQRALLVYPPGLEFLAGFFGCLYAGLVPVPATYPKPRRPLPRLDGIAADCAPQVALTTDGTLANLKLEDQSPQVRDLQWLATDPPQGADLTAGASFDRHDAEPADTAFLQYTSGSTSQPRGVVVSHANVMHNLELIRTGFCLPNAEQDAEQRGVEGVFWLPAYHDMGLIGGLLSTIYAGGTSTLMPPADFLRQPLRWLQEISKQKANVSGAPNFAYDLCAEKITPADIQSLDLSAWEIAFCGAEPIDPQTLDRFATAFSPAGFRREAFYPCYGLAEATLMVSGAGHRHPFTLNLERDALAQHRVQPSGDAKSQRLVSCGPVLSDQQVLIVDPQSQAPCPASQIGEVWIRGNSVAQRYWTDQRPTEDSNEIFAAKLPTHEGHFLRTGDLGFLYSNPDHRSNPDCQSAADSQGDHDPPAELFVTGRTKDVIIARGRNHYPQDIERTVQRAHPAIDLGAAFAISTAESATEQLVVVHQIDRQHRRSNLDEALTAIRTAIVQAHELDPYAVVLIKPVSIPLTSSGKVQRNRCRKLYLAGELSVLAQWQQASRDAVASEEASLPSSPGDLDFLLIARELGISELASRIEAWMLSLLATKVDSVATKISSETPFAELGMDSMTSIELSLEFEQALDLQLPPDAAWSHPTPAGLSRFLAEQLQQ